MPRTASPTKRSSRRGRFHLPVPSLRCFGGRIISAPTDRWRKVRAPLSFPSGRRWRGLLSRMRCTRRKAERFSRIRELTCGLSGRRGRRPLQERIRLLCKRIVGAADPGSPPGTAFGVNCAVQQVILTFFTFVSQCSPLVHLTIVHDSGILCIVISTRTNGVLKERRRSHGTGSKKAADPACDR